MKNVSALRVSDPVNDYGRLARRSLLRKIKSNTPPFQIQLYNTRGLVTVQTGDLKRLPSEKRLDGKYVSSCPPSVQL